MDLKKQHQTLIMDEIELARSIERLGDEILLGIDNPKRLLLMGILTRGVPLAQRIKEYINRKAHYDLLVGILDITLYRDDWTRLHSYPVVQSTKIPSSLEDMDIVLVDDVLYTGRTVRAALDAILDYGRPSRVHLAVLIDRGHRELPICAQYVGKTVSTSAREHIYVRLKESDGVDEVILASPDR